MDCKKHRYDYRKQCVFTRCDGLAGLWSHCSRLMRSDPDLERVVMSPKRNEWFGGSFDDLKTIISDGGWLLPVERAKSLASKISTAVNSRGARPCWRSDFVGAFSDVPAYVAGSPENMRRRDFARDFNARAPLSVWVALGASCSVCASDIERRGGLVLAAYLALSRVRRVRVRFYSTSDRGNVIVSMPENFSVSELSALSVSPNVYRRLILECCALGVQSYSNMERKNKLGRIGWANWAYDDVKTALVLRDYGYSGGDLILGPGKIGKWDAISDDDMIEEINGYVKRACSDVRRR